MEKDKSKIDIYDMVLSAEVRYKVNGKAQKKPEKPLLLADIAQCFDSLNKYPLAIDKNGKYNLQDFSYNAGTGAMVLLINRNDPDAKNPIFRDIKTNKRRPSDKADTEGIDYSCHVVMNLKGVKNRYTVAIERTIPGVSVGYIKQCMNKLITVCSKNFKDKFERNKPTGEKDDKGNYIKLKLRHEVAFSGHVSNDFITDIENGIIMELDLINDDPQASYEGTEFTEKSETLALEITNKKIPVHSKARPFLSKIFKHYDEQKYGTAKIRFTTIENAEKTVRLNTDSFTINGKEYIKSFFVPAPINQNTSYDKIQKKLTDEMFTLIK